MRARLVLAALLLVVLPPVAVHADGASRVAASASASVPASAGTAGTTDSTVPTDTAPTDAGSADTTGIADNPFLPEDRNLGDCVSSMPRPDCGSKAHGGWRQGIVFVILMLGMAFIGWRIFRAVRRADRQIPDQPA